MQNGQQHKITSELPLKTFTNIPFIQGDFLHWCPPEKFKYGKPRLGTLSKKKRDFLGIFPKGGEGGLLNSQNFCKLTKLFLVCQNMTKHVLQLWGGDI